MRYLDSRSDTDSATWQPRLRTGPQAALSPGRRLSHYGAVTAQVPYAAIVFAVPATEIAAPCFELELGSSVAGLKTLTEPTDS